MNKKKKKVSHTVREEKQARNVVRILIAGLIVLSFLFMLGYSLFI